MKISIHVNDLDIHADKQTFLQLMAMLSGQTVEVQMDNLRHEDLPPEKEAEEVRHAEPIRAEPFPPGPPDLLIANAYAKPVKDGQPVQVLLIPYGRFSVKTWKDVLVETAETLIAAQLLPFKTIDFANSLIPIVTTSKRSARPLVRLTNGLYMDAGHSAKDIVRRAVALVQSCGLSDKAFAVYYKK